VKSKIVIPGYGDQGVEFELPTKRTWKTGNACIDHILNKGHFNRLLEDAALPQIRTRWRTELRAAINTPPSTDELSTAFHTQWHVCHHRLRNLVEDDALLLDVAWIWLPRYVGPGLELYRGENIDRFKAGRLGSAWSDRRETAETFASGLNAIGMGGVILRSSVPHEAVIAGPSAHSFYLDESEFTVDTRKIGAITVIARFPPSH
jgi:hypothetical protein